ncbi:MAG: phosphoribosylaminoimidazolesuccinocarboxamide synthase [Candidatus Gracilibacteria bacterium]
MTYSILGPDGRPFDGTLDGAQQVNFGKTKKVYRLPNGDFGIEHKDIITAFDNPDFTGHAPGKGTASAYSTALLYKRLEKKGVKTAHRGILNANTTLEEGLDMLPFEIIWRRYNVEGNSWEKRHPGEVEIGAQYEAIKYEACLKWSVKDTDGKKIDDPFLILDENFKPLLRADGMPRLMHPKEVNKELDYTSVIHPNKGGEIRVEEVSAGIQQFSQYAGEIRQMLETVQETTFDTYAQIGRLNADGKIEVGRNTQGELVLGDELELDALRNMSLKKIRIHGQEYEYEEDLLGQNLNEVITEGAVHVGCIVLAEHSGKQRYRDQVKVWKDTPMSSARQDANDSAAQNVTKTVYIPVAQALSDRFGREVGYTFQTT